MEPTIYAKVITNQADAERQLLKIDVDPNSIGIMAPKMSHIVIKIKDLDVRAANVLKQEMLSKGAEAAVAKWASSFTKPKTDVLLMGTLKQYRLVMKKLLTQPYGLPKLVDPIKRALASLSPGERTLKFENTELRIGGRTLVMGILNVTPDSFSEPGQYFDVDQAVQRALSMADEGADIIDVGGESTRPGAESVSVEEEKGRVVPVIERLAAELSTPISIDTSKAEVASAAASAGAVIVNDVTALGGDERMANVAAESGLGVILMHMKGKPTTMQENPVYDDLITEIYQYLQQRIKVAESAGVNGDKILIDPGIGFGKTVQDNLELLKRLPEFLSLDRPLVVGTSRKSTIGEVLGGLAVSERLEGTAATVSAAILGGADMVRVHDVKAMARVCKMTDAIALGADWHG